MKVKGTAWKFPQDDINTDQIRRKMYAHLSPIEQARHCLETLDPEFAGKVTMGDVLVAGKNFGCGSSTAAYMAIKALGITAIIAESFSRIFLRNCIFAGLPAIPLPGILQVVSTGDCIEADATTARIWNVTSGKSLSGVPLPELLQEMIECGGEKQYLKSRLLHMAR